MPTMMRCSRPFAEGKIRVHVNGRDYQFAPNRLGHSVCMVADEDVFTMTNISGAYSKYASATVPRIDLTPPDPEAPIDALDEGGEGSGDPDDIREATPAFLEVSPPPATARKRHK
jgi:hypothetical protein